MFRQLREAVGNSVDLCIEIHRRMTPAEAIALGRGIEKYKPMFFEDPLRPNSFDAMAWVADHIPIAVATGERFTSMYQFQTLLTRHAVEYLRPDVCLCGGITGSKKIAAIAEAHDAQIVPHNPLIAGQPCGVPADFRLHPELRHPGIPNPHPGAGGQHRPAGRRPRHRAGRAGWRLHCDPRWPGYRAGTRGRGGEALPAAAAADPHAAARGWRRGRSVIHGDHGHRLRLRPR